MRKVMTGHSLKLMLILVLALTIAGAVAGQQTTATVLASDNQTPSLYLEPAVQNISVNASANITIKIKNISALYAAEVHLTFPSDLLEVQDADADKDGIQIAPSNELFPFTPGQYYVDNTTSKKYYYSHSDNSGGYFIARAEASNASGNISYALTLLHPSQPVSAGPEGKALATITFKRLAPGTANITFASPAANELPVKLADATGTAIALSPADMHGALIVSALAGDANGDGKINAVDITKVERIIAGLDALTPGADTNGDGQINALDITKVERIIVGLD